MDYKETILWKKSIDNTEYGNDSQREELRQAFFRVRDNAKYILDKIRNDFPSLTVHDISHVDSLWQVGSVITGDDYDINPLEGFVLGCAFLMHDAVLSYEAAGGRERLRDTIEWKDYYADYKEKEYSTEEIRLYETDFSTIRLLHAKYAEQLYKQLFEKEDGSRFYIIEDESLRIHLGEIICKIAASHHWNIEDVEKLGCQFSAISGFPREWRINPIKLACILRCADAGHIDAGRAPDYLLKLLDINGVSRNHWIAQNRLSQIDTDLRDDSKVIIRSNMKFGEEDFAAWNVAYDAVCVLNHELKVSNELMKRNNICEFQAHSVTGADSQEHLCQYIETDGWMPCNASVHISNIEGLINNLGGEKLYGSEHKLEIVLRELIQNGRDAICARRMIDRDFEGKIIVSVEKVEGITWITVKDNGIGMSLLTLKDYLLNFGSSFWASDLAKREFPGLNSSGYKSVGQFGIGFYAVFMIASEVRVETRRFDKSFDDAYVVKFPKGLCLRPIISNTRSNSSSYSTTVRFSIDELKYRWNSKVEIRPGIQGVSPFEVPFSAVLSNLTAGLDVDVFYKEEEKNEEMIHSDFAKMEIGSNQMREWLKDITYARYRGGNLYTEYIDSNYQRVTKLYSDGKCYGVAAINTLWQANASYFDVTTVGGLATFSHASNDAEFLGCILVEPNTAKRDGNVKKNDNIEWAKEQYSLLYKNGLSEIDRLRLPYIMGQYSIDMTNIMLVRVVNKGGEVFLIQLKNLLFELKDKKLKLIFPLSSYSTNDRIEYYLDYERTREMMSENELLFVVETNCSFLNTEEEDKDFPLNIVNCIRLLSKNLSIKLKETVLDGRAVSRLGGICKALIIDMDD